MNLGMLWFDNDPKAGLSTKVERAAAYYRNKYGQVPTLCFVHPSMLAVEPGTATGEPAKEEMRLEGGVVVRSNKSIRPNHFWIGVNGANGG